MKEKFLTWVSNNKGAAIGIVAGLVLAILIFTINFWRTLLLLILVAIGYLIGHAGDRGTSIFERVSAWLDKLLKR